MGGSVIARHLRALTAATTSSSSAFGAIEGPYAAGHFVRQSRGRPIERRDARHCPGDGERRRLLHRRPRPEASRYPRLFHRRLSRSGTGPDPTSPVLALRVDRACRVIPPRWRRPRRITRIRPMRRTRVPVHAVQQGCERRGPIESAGGKCAVSTLMPWIWPPRIRPWQNPATVEPAPNAKVQVPCWSPRSAAEVATLRVDGLTRSLSSDAAERFLHSASRFEQMHLNFKSLEQCVAEWAGSPGQAGAQERSRHCTARLGKPGYFHKTLVSGVEAREQSFATANG
jgi:hypothetical protein